MADSGAVLSPATSAGLGVVLALPVVGLLVLMAAPSTDVHWEHRPSHFWLVLATATVSAVLGWSVGNAALRRPVAPCVQIAPCPSAAWHNFGV